MDSDPHTRPEPKRRKTALSTLPLHIASLHPLTSATAPLRPLRTGYDALDTALHGGLPRGGLAEIYGPPGSGKTTLALSLLASVVASGGKALHIDCDGSFHAKRFLQLLGRFECEKDTASARLQVARCTSWEALVSGLAHTLPGLMREGGVQLVVIDSLTFMFRLAQGAAVSKRLEAFAMRMHEAAAQVEASVVLVNHGKKSPEGGPVVAAMGEAWQHVCATRLCVARDERGQGVVEIIKSPLAKRTRIPFTITLEGMEHPYPD